MHEKLEFLCSLARMAGSIMLRHWGGEIHAFEKSDGSIVTEVDLEISRRVCASIQKQYPDCSLLTEETRGKLLYPQRCGFIIDELDGTHGYFKGKSGFTFQCAYYEKYDQLMIGLIYDPLRDVLVYGIRGEGVFWETQNKKLKISHAPKLAWEELRYANHRRYMTGTLKRMYESLGAREEQIIPTGGIGSKAIDFVEGKVDVLISLNRSIGAWDWAPGKVILEELGYKLCHLTGEELEVDQNGKAFGYLVCPPEHYGCLIEKLDWILKKVRRRDREEKPNEKIALK